MLEERHISFDCIIYITRKYPLRGYFVGVLTHTTGLDRLWRGDKTLNCVEYTQLGFALPTNAVFWWQQHDYGHIFVALIVCLTTLLSKVFSFNDFFGGRDGEGDVT